MNTTPAVPDYSRDERDRFFWQLAEIGDVIVRQSIPVTFDATANRRGIAIMHER